MSTTHLWIKKQSTMFTKHTGAHRIEPESDGDCVTRFQVWNSRPAPPLDSFAEGVLLCTAQRPTIFSMHLSPHQKLQLGECSPSTADPDSGYSTPSLRYGAMADSKPYSESMRVCMYYAYTFRVGQ